MPTTGDQALALSMLFLPTTKATIIYAYSLWLSRDRGVKLWLLARLLHILHNHIGPVLQLLYRSKKTSSISLKGSVPQTLHRSSKVLQWNNFRVGLILLLA
jgi:type IV secretory pathway TrbD component